MNRIQQGCTVGQGKSFPYSARRAPLSSADILPLGARVHKQRRHAHSFWAAAVSALFTSHRQDKWNDLFLTVPYATLRTESMDLYVAVVIFMPDFGVLAWTIFPFPM